MDLSRIMSSTRPVACPNWRVSVTVTRTCRFCRSGTMLMAGDCASMTTAAVLCQRSASQSTAHWTPSVRVERYSCREMNAVPSSCLNASPRANALLSGGMSTPNESRPSVCGLATSVACHASSPMTSVAVRSSQMPSASRRNESSARRLRMRRIASSLVRFGYDGFAFAHAVLSSRSQSRSAPSST